MTKQEALECAEKLIEYFNYRCGYDDKGACADVEAQCEYCVFGTDRLYEFIKQESPND